MKDLKQSESACGLPPLAGLPDFIRNYSVKRNARPHPSPLLRGEGEYYSALENIHRLMPDGGPCWQVPSPRGRGLG